jgi:nicotinate phosphoribosyltransferase
MCEFTLKQQGKIPRLTNKTFQLDQRIGSGVFSAEYFLKTQKILSNHFGKSQPDVLLQFFQRKEGIVCGIDESLAIIKEFAHNYKSLIIHAINDGDYIKPFESVLTIKGSYKDFGFLEGVIDGVLARRTSIATNAYNIKKTLLPHQDLIFMGDREDIYTNQVGDGYAVCIGGIEKVATDAMGQWTGAKGIGTMPHALIQSFGGNLLNACKAYVDTFPNEPLIALVDYNNDVITDSLIVAKYFGQKLKAVRVDTSPTMVDKHFSRNMNEMGTFDPRGVNVELIKVLRQNLDSNGFEYVKIIVSGNFNQEKISLFNKEKAPVDVFGVGSAILKINHGFTGDCVEVNGEHQAKMGRRKSNNSRMMKA